MCMKSALKILLVFALTIFSIDSYAQKIGHISMEELVSVMPETITANKELEILANAYTKELEEIDVEMKNKFVVYQNNLATWTEQVAAAKLDELNALSQKYQERMAEAEEDFQQKQNAKLAPIIEKAKSTVNKVAKQNGVAYLYDSRMLLYADEASAFDLLPLVKKELGIQ